MLHDEAHEPLGVERALRPEGEASDAVGAVVVGMVALAVACGGFVRLSVVQRLHSTGAARGHELLLLRWHDGE